MERPQWLRDEKTDGGSFWHRNPAVAIQTEEAISGELLAALERWLARWEDKCGPPPQEDE